MELPIPAHHKGNAPTMEDNKKYLKQSMDEIVFDNRNKAYGAYFLRQITRRNTFRALVVMTGMSALLTGFTFVDFGSLLNKNDEASIERVVTLTEPPPLDEAAPPPPPPPPPPPVRPTTRFVEMVVKKDEEVVEEDLVAQTDIKTDIATVTQEGDEDADIVIETAPVVTQAPVVEKKKVYDFIEQMPEYPGGTKKLYDYLYANIEYPRMARDNGVEGTVYLKFIVDEKGEVSDVQLLRGIGAGCDEEAMRVVRNMPNWTPGKQNGAPAAVWYKLPIKFSLGD